MEIINSQLLVNGVAIRIKGTNMHEHDDVNGHVVDEATDPERYQGDEKQ